MHNQFFCYFFDLLCNVAYNQQCMEFSVSAQFSRFILGARFLRYRYAQTSDSWLRRYLSDWRICVAYFALITLDVALSTLIFLFQFFIIDDYTIHKFMREHDLHIYEHIKQHIAFGLPVSRLLCRKGKYSTSSLQT